MKNVTEKKYFYLMMILFFVLCGISFLRYPDLRNEMKYFVVLSEMLQNKEYLILSYLGELYPDKPPLYFWILGVIKAVFDKEIYPVALILAGIIPLYIEAILLKKIFKTYLVPLIFLTLSFSSGASLVLRMDTLMSMFITVAIVNFYLAYEEYKLYPEKDVELKYFLLIFISIGLAILVKGGGGAVVPLLTIIFFTYLNKERDFLKKLKIKKGILIVISIVLIWFISIYFSKNGKEYLSLMLGKQTVGRVVNSYAHKRPIFYYLKNIFLTTMPFGIPFLTGIALYLKDFKNVKGWNSLEKLSIAWIIPSFIFFSFISGKLDIYLLPIYPGIAGLIYCFYNRKEWRKYFEKSLFITYILLILGVAALIAVSNISKYNLSFLCKGMVIVLFLVTLWFFYKLKDSDGKNRGISNISVVFIMLLSVAFYESRDFNENYTIKPLQSYMVDIAKNKNKNVVLFRFEDGVNFLETLDVPYKKYKEVSEFKDDIEKNRDIVIIVREKDVEKLKELEENSNYKVLFKNYSFYLIEIKRAN